MAKLPYVLVADCHRLICTDICSRQDLLNVGEGLKDFPDVALQCIDDQVRTEAMSLPEGERLSSVLNDLYRALGITNTDLWAGSKRATGMAILVGGRTHGYECETGRSSFAYILLMLTIRYKMQRFAGNALGRSQCVLVHSFRCIALTII